MSALTGINEFSVDMKRFAGSIGIKIETARKKIGIELLASVRKRTPVDTGRARANWDITVGAPSASVDEMPDLKKGAAIPAPQMPTEDELGDTTGKSIFIINNLKYIEALEHGHSQQAPAGMVEPAMLELEAQLALIAKAVRSQ